MKAPLDEKVTVRRKPPAGVVNLHCPRCGRFLAQVLDFARAICRECGCEVEYRSKAARELA